MNPTLKLLPALLLLLVSCKSGELLERPNATYVAADRATYDVVGEAMLGFIDADTLRPLELRAATPPTEDEPSGHPRSDIELANLTALIESWAFRLRQAELALEGE